MKISILFLSLALSIHVFGQPKPKKIQIVLLGTFHFNQSLDSSSRLHSNLFSSKRQKEVANIVQKLGAFDPNKIFIEQEPSRQPFWDSIYDDFKKGIPPSTIKLKANEITQLGLSTAKKLGLEKLICVDFQPENYAEADFNTPYKTEKTIKSLWDEIAAYSDSIRTNAIFFDKRYPIKRPNGDSLLQKSSLRDYLLYINSPESYTYYNWSDWNWFYSLGKKYEYIGSDWLANFWYGRNMRIYSNILRQTNFEKDKKYLVIYGSAHISFLKYLFETNPFFEVVSLESVLK